jgi:hypothetical protein
MFASEHRYPGFLWLGNCGQKWVARDRVPASLLESHDAALVALDIDEHDMVAAVAWMNACDSIAERVNPILDGPALRAYLDAELRKRAFDAMMRRQSAVKPF